MKCPICKANVNELADFCPNCKTNFDEYEEYSRKHGKEESRTNADILNFMANLNITLTIISSIVIWLKFSTVEMVSKYGIATTEMNWYGIIGGFGIFISGFTLFFLLKTIVDIYYEVEK